METNSRVYYGSDIKLSLSVDFGEDIEVIPDFEVTFYMGMSHLTLRKEQLIKVDDNTYLACIKAPRTQRGEIKAFIKAHYNDGDFEDGIHTIVEPIELNVKVV